MKKNALICSWFLVSKQWTIAVLIYEQSAIFVYYFTMDLGVLLTILSTPWDWHMVLSHGHGILSEEHGMIDIIK